MSEDKIDMTIIGSPEIPLTDEEVDAILNDPEWGPRTPFEQAAANRLQLLSDLLLQKAQTEHRMAQALAALSQRVAALESTPKSSIIMPPKSLLS